MPTSEDANGDSDASQQPPTPPIRPPVKRTKDGEGGDDESKRGNIQYCKEKPDHWSKGVEAICAIILVFITGYYAFYARKQAASSETAAHAAENAVGVASRTLKETQRSNNRQADLSELARKSSETATKDALNATIDNFHRDQRAWLSADPAHGTPKPNADFEVAFPITNTGRTPATNVVAYFIGTYFPLQRMGPFTFQGEPIPLGYIPPNGHINFRYRSGPNPNAIDVEKIADGKVWVVYGAVTYNDVFTGPHWITYCFFSNKTDDYAYCRIHNDIGDGPLPKGALDK